MWPTPTSTSPSARVLRPGGRMLLSTHGIMPWHPDPIDLWRWTSEGLQREISQHGFEIERFEGVMGLGPTGVQLLQDSLYHRVPHRTRSLLALICQSAIRLLARFDRPDERRRDALVYATVARRT